MFYFCLSVCLSVCLAVWLTADEDHVIVPMDSPDMIP